MGKGQGGQGRIVLSLLCAVLCSVAQLYPTLCDTLDCSPPGSSVYGILQARILDWVAISPPGVFLTQGSNLSLLCLLYWQADSLPSELSGNFILKN